MKHLKRSNIIYFIIALLVIILMVFGIGYYKKIQTQKYISATEKSVSSEIEKANHCNNSAECIATSFGCPFGCLNYINKAEEEKLRELTKKYHKDIYPDHCVYKCSVSTIYDRLPICSNNKCIAGNKDTFDCHTLADYIKDQISWKIKRCEDYPYEKTCKDMSKELFDFDYPKNKKLSILGIVGEFENSVELYRKNCLKK